MSGWWVEHTAGWSVAIEALVGDGWQIEGFTEAGPVQLWGVMPSGLRFYFRARHDHVELAAGGDDPADLAPLNASETWVNASYLGGSDGLELIHRLATALSADD